MANTATKNRSRIAFSLLALTAVGGGLTLNAFGIPAVTPAAQAAPGDQHTLTALDLGTLAEGDPIPGSGGQMLVPDWDVSEWLSDGEIVTGAPFTLTVEGGILSVSWQGQEVADYYGIDSAFSATITITVGEAGAEEYLILPITGDWSAAAEDEPEPEPEFEVAGLNGRSPGSDGAYCLAGDLTIPLTGAEEGVTYGGEVDLPYGTATLAEDGSALIIEGYDPAARAGTGLSTTPSIVTVFESEAFTATDGEQTDEDVFVSVGLGTWCGQDIEVASTDDGTTYEIDLTGLFDSITTPGEYVRPAEWMLSGLPTPDLGELTAYDADGNIVEFFGGPGEPTLAGMATTLLFTPAEGANVEDFTLSVSRQDGAKGVVPAPVSISLAPVEIPEEPTEPETPDTPDEPEDTPEQPTPDEPEDKTPEVPRVSE